MSRNIPARSAISAVAVAVVAVAVLLGLILWGKHAAEAHGSSAAQVPAGFTAIEGDDIFATIAEAQQEAGSWEVATVAYVQGQAQPNSVVQVDDSGEKQVFTVRLTTQGGVAEGIWDGSTFYEKNPQGTGAEQWFSYPEGTLDEAALKGLSTDVAASAEDFTIIETKVVGSEVITDLDDHEIDTVKYRVIMEPKGDAAAAGVDPSAQRVQVDLWLDEENRPIQVRGIATSSSSETTTLYSKYGESFDIKAPSPDQVTERSLEQQQPQ